MEKQGTSERYKAIVLLEQYGRELSNEETGNLLAIAYPEMEIHTFVNTFLRFVDPDQFDSETSHVGCPLACIEVLLAYRRAGGQVLSSE